MRYATLVNQGAVAVPVVAFGPLARDAAAVSVADLDGLSALT